MRYISTLFFSFLAVLSLAQDENKPKVVATASMIADMVENIGGNLIDVETIVPIGGDPHLHDPTPRDARLVAGADLVLKNGLTFEGWLNELIDNSGTKADIVTVTKGVDHIASSTYKNSADPHAWMDAENGLIYIENIKDALVKLDPNHQEEFEFNYNIYRQQMLELDEYIKKEIQKIPTKQRILITSHDAFEYYGKKYGLRLEAVLGTSTDAEAQTSDITRLNKVIQESKVPAVFVESTINPKMLEQIAKDNGVKIGGKLYADSIGKKGSKASTYLNMLKYNTDVIVNALSEKMNDGNEEELTEKSGSNNLILFGIMGLLLFGGFFVVYKKLS